ncbi:MAG: HAMP domain-containing histidine kinase [Cyanobacteria bacterium]|nr:HAMP domain-containing histidine kinase [Cyanobacteriota bacterium]
MKRLKLGQKGLIFILAVLTVELTLFAILGYLLHEAEVELNEEAHQKAINSGANQLIKLYYNATTSLFAYDQTRSSFFFNLYKQSTRSIPQQFHLLKILVADDKESLSALVRMEEASNHLLSILSLAEDSFKSKRSELLPDARQMQGDVLTTLKTLMSELSAIAGKEQVVTTASPESNTRQLIKTALIAALGANVILATILVQAFMIGITGRLSTISENTLRLIRKEPLLPRVTGEDEIAQLDSFFHDMKDKLDENARIKSQFFAMVTHEIRSPLAAIRASLNLLTDGVAGQLPDKAIERINSTEHSAVRLLGLINNLLDIEKIEAGKLEVSRNKAALSQILDEAVGAVSSLAEQRNIDITISGADVIVFADAERLVQVLINLLSNALKFSPRQSEITVTCGLSDGKIAVRIQDQGPGVPNSFMPQLFSPFMQAGDGRLRTGGSGLGLTISKAIIEAHNGLIGVESQEGQGSTFWFTIDAYLDQEHEGCSN